jgi:hypothetical protein
LSPSITKLIADCFLFVEQEQNLKEEDRVEKALKISGVFKVGMRSYI